MPSIGVIVREPGGIPLREWLEVIASEDTLRTIAPLRGVNPFTRQPMDFRRSYAAHVVFNGTDIGSMCWEANHIFVSGPADELEPLARAVAERLRARFYFNADLPARIDDQ